MSWYWTQQCITFGVSETTNECTGIITDCCVQNKELDLVYEQRFARFTIGHSFYDDTYAIAKLQVDPARRSLLSNR